MGTPTLVVARTDAEAAKLLTSDIDERDRPFVDKDKDRTVEGFYQVRNGIEPCIARAVAYAPYCDLIWMETGKPDLAQAKKFAEGVRRHHPGKLAGVQLLALVQLEEEPRRRHHREVPARTRRHGLQIPVHHAGRLPPAQFGMFELARGYKARQMAAYSELQEAEFAAEANGYTATKHQREVGTGYFDAVSMAITGGKSSTTAMHESTEHAQFKPAC